MIRNKDFLHVYIAKMPFPHDGVILKERQEEIEKCTNLRVKEEKFYSWKLLEVAIEEKLGIDPRTIKFKRMENGKWTCDKCHFSISHSHDVIMVAISNKPVGVDIECLLDNRDYLSLKERTLTKDEPCDDPMTFLKYWTKKEAYFKYSDLDKYVPLYINTNEFSNVITKEALIECDRFVYSVISDNVSLCTFNFINVQISI